MISVFANAHGSSGYEMKVIVCSISRLAAQMDSRSQDLGSVAVAVVVLLVFLNPKKRKKRFVCQFHERGLKDEVVTNGVTREGLRVSG
jgi:hypothetical protein